MSDYPERCTVCKRTREHGIHQYAIEGSMMRHPDYHEFTTPTDSAMTAAAIAQAREALMAKTTDMPRGSVEAVTWSPIVADPYKAVALVQRVATLTAERTKLAADLARVVQVSESWKTRSFDNARIISDWVKRYDSANERALAAEAKSARLVEALNRSAELLRKYAVHMEYDCPGDTPEPCGLWCPICERHVNDVQTDHAKDCPCDGAQP